MDILFWSGGKDSYLALECFKRSYNPHHLQLLTTYREDDEIVPFQNISMQTIRQHASGLNLDLIEVPLPGDSSNEVYLERIQRRLESQDNAVERLVFGDWANTEIKQWREKAFQRKLNYECVFPIWQKDLHQLLPILTLHNVKVYITNVDEEWEDYIKVGEEYNQRFISTLPSAIDPMGENGEFHTRVEIQSFRDPDKQELFT